jgi:hypothetical protein
MIRFDPVDTRRHVAGQFIWFALWLGVTSFGIYLTPSPEGHGTHTQLGLPPCPCVMIFGRPCPGCGLTTSFTALLHGQFRAAFRAHPLGPFLYAIFTVSALLGVWGWKNRKRVDASSKPMRMLSGFAVTVFLVFGITRFVLSPHYGDHDPYHQLMVAAKR